MVKLADSGGEGDRRLERKKAGLETPQTRRVRGGNKGNEAVKARH